MRNICEICFGTFKIYLRNKSNFLFIGCGTSILLCSSAKMLLMLLNQLYAWTVKMHILQLVVKTWSAEVLMCTLPLHILNWFFAVIETWENFSMKFQIWQVVVWKSLVWQVYLWPVGALFTYLKLLYFLNLIRNTFNGKPVLRNYRMYFFLFFFIFYIHFL